jgi:hypothetical protein
MATLCTSSTVAKVLPIGRGWCRDRATALVEDICFEKIRGCSYRDAERPTPCLLYPIATKSTAQRNDAMCHKRKWVLFNHLIGAGEQRERHGEAERFCSLHVDD